MTSSTPLKDLTATEQFNQISAICRNSLQKDSKRIDVQASFDYGSIGTSRVLPSGFGGGTDSISHSAKHPSKCLKDLETELRFKDENITDLISQLLHKDTRISHLEDMNESLEASVAQLRDQLSRLHDQLNCATNIIRSMYDNLPDSMREARKFLFEGNGFSGEN